MKTACFILHSDLFTPWPIIRAMKEIEVLKENGWEISVVSWIKSSSELPPAEVKDDIKLLRYFLQPPEKNFVRRLLTYMKMSKNVYKKILELKPDIMVCHDLEMLYSSVKAAKALKVPLFYDAHENWPEMVALNSKFEAKCFALLQKRLLKHVTHSYTYGDDFSEKLRDMGFPATTLFNSKSLDVVPSIEEADIEQIKEQLGLTKTDFIIGYSGAASLENGLQQTIDALQLLPTNVKFLVVGGSYHGENLEKARRYAEKKKIPDRVIFTGKVPSDVLLKYISVFDVGTALFQPLSANEIARVPNKIFDYMALSIPMIVSDFPNMKKIVVEESDCGYAVPPMEIESIKRAVMQFYDHPEDVRVKGEKGRAMFEKMYCWDVQKKKLIESHEVWQA